MNDKEVMEFIYEVKRKSLDFAIMTIGHPQNPDDVLKIAKKYEKYLISQFKTK